MPVRARLVDVAARAAVSTATASLVLRGRAGPSAAARERVQAAAAELGYRPDRAASVLARHRSRLLGVVLDVTNPFQAELAANLDTEAASRDLDIVLAPVTSRRDEAAAAETLVDFRCEALVLIGPELSGARIAVLATAVPTVVIGRAGTGGALGVHVDDAAGVGAAVRHLLALGHERIGYVDGPRGVIATTRRRGYLQAMRRGGFAGAALVLPGGNTEEAGLVAGRSLVQQPPDERPTAVVAFNDRCAIGIRESVLRAGLRLPDELSIVGYDDSPPARMATVDLTSVSQDPTALAAAAVASAWSLLEGGPAPRDVVVAPRLVTRGSTAPPRPGQSEALPLS